MIDQNTFNQDPDTSSTLEQGAEVELEETGKPRRVAEA